MCHTSLHIALPMLADRRCRLDVAAAAALTNPIGLSQGDSQEVVSNLQLRAHTLACGGSGMLLCCASWWFVVFHAVADVVDVIHSKGVGCTIRGRRFVQYHIQSTRWSTPEKNSWRLGPHAGLPGAARCCVRSKRRRWCSSKCCWRSSKHQHCADGCRHNPTSRRPRSVSMTSSPWTLDCRSIDRCGGQSSRQQPPPPPAARAT